MFGEAGVANNAFGAMLDARLQVCKRAFGSSEVDQAVGVGKRIKVVADQYAGVAPKQGASILPQGRGPAAIQGNRELQVGAVCNGLTQHEELGSASFRERVWPYV